MSGEVEYSKAAVEQEQNAPKSPRNLQRDLIRWRRGQVATLLAQGKSPKDIQNILQLNQPLVSKDIKWLRQQASTNILNLIEKELPLRHVLRAAGVDKVIAELWELHEQEQDSARRKNILDSITEAYQVQASIDSDPSTIDRVLKAVTTIKERVKRRSRTAGGETEEHSSTVGEVQAEA